MLAYREDKFTEGLRLQSPWTRDFFLQVLGLVILIFCTLIAAACSSKKVSSFIFDPLRKFNGKLINIKIEGMKKDLPEQKDVSKEISELSEVFGMFIRTKKFENNDFQNKEDALAIIDLAEACKMF